MKIIFDSEKQKEKFLKELDGSGDVCAVTAGIKEKCTSTTGCEGCWAACIETEVKNGSNNGRN